MLFSDEAENGFIGWWGKISCARDRFATPLQNLLQEFGSPDQLRTLFGRIERFLRTNSFLSIDAVQMPSPKDVYIAVIGMSPVSPVTPLKTISHWSQAPAG